MGYAVVTLAPDTLVPVKGTRLFTESFIQKSVKAVITLYDEQTLDQNENTLHLIIHSDSKTYDNITDDKKINNLLCDTNEKMVAIVEIIANKLTSIV